MELVRTNKYRLHPNAVQKSMLHEMFGFPRFVFNYTLGKIQESYFGTYEVQKAQNGKNKGSIVPKIPKIPKIPNQTGIVGFSTNIKEEHNSISRAPNASLTNLYKATKGFYKGGGFPKFKSRKTSKQSINMYAGSRVKIEEGFILLNRSNKSSYSKEYYKIRFKKHNTNHEIGKITGFTIEKDNLGLYWIATTHKLDVTLDRKKTNKKVGRALGLKSMLICSDGTTIENHNLTKKSKMNQRKLKIV